MKTKRITVAGALVKETIYPRGAAHDAPRTRAAKRKMSSAAQQRMNEKNRREKLEMELAANFLPRDHFVTLTFRPDALPEDEAGVDKCVKAFLRRLRKDRGKGHAPVVYWRAEHKHRSDDVWTDARWHVHAVVNADSGSDVETFCRCWPYGSVDVKPLRIDAKPAAADTLELERVCSYAQLAAYLIKEPLDRPGAHAWHSTRNAKKPETESFSVPDDTPLQAPKGSVILESVSEANQYGSWRYQKYLNPAALRGPRRPRARRRR